ncbi:hypothetical protein D4R42_05220 [bacterium]|nr:MAG: hypothetical protein D4R42_05220 [bacterium]
MNVDNINPEVKQEAMELKHTASELKILDSASMQKGGECLREIKTVRKRLKDVFKPIVDAQKAAYQVTVGEFKKYDDPLKLAEVTVKQGIGTYQVEAERKRKAAEEKLQEEARKQAEEIQLQAASQAEQNGNADAAEAIISQPVAAPRVKIEKEVTEGVSTRKLWSAEVTDLMALVKAVAAGEQPLTFLKADTTALNSMAKAQKELMKVPGVEAVSKVTVAARSY